MLPIMRTYAVQRAARVPLVEFLIAGLEDAGCKVLFVSSVERAPFVVSFEVSSGERMGIVAYAFLSTRTPTKNRPSDERSFQIKYGSKDDRLHDLYQDPLQLSTTLLLGIDPIEDYFVAADPVLHSPTKFFIRLEYKDRHVEGVERSGWYAWRRVRRPSSLHPEPFECLVGGRRDRLVDLVKFERSIRGGSQSARLKAAGT